MTAMPPGVEPAVPYDRSFDATYGLEIFARDDGEMRARIAVRPEVCDRHGALAGGVLAAAAEALASRGTALAVMPAGQIAQGLSNDTTVIGEVRDGAVEVVARVVGRGLTEWVWTAEARDGDGRVCGISRVTVAVRAAR